MERLALDAEKILLLIGLFAIIPIAICLRRKKLSVTLPCAFAFLLYAAIAIPNILPPRLEAARNACVANLEFIERAKAEWARQNHESSTVVPSEADLFGTNKVHRYMPSCPDDGTYTIGAINQPPTCSLAKEGHVMK